MYSASVVIKILTSRAFYVSLFTFGHPQKNFSHFSRINKINSQFESIWSSALMLILIWCIDFLEKIHVRDVQQLRNLNSFVLIFASIFRNRNKIVGYTSLANSSTYVFSLVIAQCLGACRFSTHCAEFMLVKMILHSGVLNRSRFVSFSCIQSFIKFVLNNCALKLTYRWNLAFSACMI